MNSADRIGFITSLAIHVSETTEASISFEYAANVETFIVRIYENGHTDEGFPDETYRARSGSESYDETLISIENRIKSLGSLLDAG